MSIDPFLPVTLSIYLVVGIVFTLSGGYSLVRLLETVDGAFRSPRWPTTTGTIVVSDVQRNRDSEGASTYRAEITYRYIVRGTEYVGDRPVFCSFIGSPWSKRAVQLVRRFPAGASVPVHYDADDPGESVLVPGLNRNILGALLFTAVMILIGAFGIATAVAGDRP
jgi:hypothetical protein